MPLLTQYILEIYGWRGATLLISGICFNAVICGTLIKPIRSDDSDSCFSKTHKQEKSSFLSNITNTLDCSLFVNFSFVSLFFISVGSGYYTTGWLVYAVSYALDIGYSPYEASAVATAGGVGNLIGNCLFPFLGQFMSSKVQLYISLGHHVSYSCLHCFGKYVTVLHVDNCEYYVLRFV